MKPYSFLAATATATAIATFALATPASASLLDGNSVGIQYLFPDSGTVFADLGSNLVGTDPPTTFNPYFDFVFTDTTASASAFQQFATWSATAFNGFRLYDINGTIDAFTSVTIDSLSNMVGLDASRITFDADNIYVNWQGLSFSEETIVTLNINGADVNVPEPGSLALLGVAMAGLGWSRRRKTVQAV